jgi:hypothetical protein
LWIIDLRIRIWIGKNYLRIHTDTDSKIGCGGTTGLPEAAVLAGEELPPTVDGQLVLLQREGLRGLVVALSTRVFHLQYIVKGLTDPDWVVFTFMVRRGRSYGLWLIGEWGSFYKFAK